MGGLRSKFLIALVIYFAGFATSIYLQAPAMDSTGVRQIQEQGIKQDMQETRMEVIADKIKFNFRKYLSIAEEKASNAKVLLKAKLDE